MKRDTGDFEKVYGEEAAEQSVIVGDASVTPDRAEVAAAEERLEAARRLAEAADRAYDVAEDGLVDAEGAVAVAEFKAEDYEAAEVGKARWELAAVREELAKANRAFQRAGQRMGRAEAERSKANSLLERAEGDLQRARETPAAEPVQVVLRFASLPVFVEDFVLPNWVHRMGDQYAGRWCRSWWEHAEAVTRLEAIWEAFEVMRQQPPPSFSTWLRDHFDSHMRMLTAVEGVFYRCNGEDHDEMHQVHEQWASVPPPAEMFPVDETAMVQPSTRDEEEEPNDD